MKLRLWVRFVILVLAVIAVMAVRCRVVVPPAPPNPGEFNPAWPGSELSEEEYLSSLVKSFEPVVYGIVPDPVVAQRRLDNLWPVITKAAKDYGLDPYLLRGLLYLEGRGKQDLVSGASCAGVAQFYPPTARGFSLKVSKNWRALYNAYTREKKLGRKAKKWAKLQEYDERFDPVKAIPAAARYLAYLRDKYHGIDYAIAAYHMGEPNLDKALQAYRLGWEAPDRFSWFDLIMDAAPNRHPKTFAFLHDKLEDESWTYYFRVLASAEASRLWKEDRFTYKVKTDFYETMARRGRRPRLAQEFYWYEDKMKLVPPLVKLTERHTNLIIDPGVSHPELTPQMAGMLYYLVLEVKKGGGKPIRITSAYRTYKDQAYQVKKGRSPSLFTSHRYASGADLGLPDRPLTSDLLEWNLMKLRARGAVVYYREKSHYHVTINPKASYFARIVEELDKYLAKAQAYDEWVKKWAKVKPVGFWQGFWGRLFSWPWLLVLAIGIYISVRLDRRP
jgi:hypothetical protein